MLTSPQRGAGDPPLNLMPLIREAFERPPDAAGILQGVRPLRQGKPHVRIVLMPSPKNGNRIIAAEGRLEAAMVNSLELDPSAAAFRGQPFPMPGPNGRDLVCDLVVRHMDGTYTVIDVKPAGALLFTKVQKRMAHVSGLLAQSHVAHRVFTERELELQPSRQIRDQLRRGAKTALTEYQRDQVLAFVRRGPTTVGKARTFAMNEGIAPLAIEKLALLEHLTFRIDAPWGISTLIGDRHERTSSPYHRWGSVRDVVVRI